MALFDGAMISRKNAYDFWRFHFQRNQLKYIEFHSLNNVNISVLQRKEFLVKSLVKKRVRFSPTNLVIIET